MSGIRQPGFSKKLHNRLYKYSKDTTKTPKELRAYERLSTISPSDITLLMNAFWEEVSEQLRKGKRIMFDGWISIFLKPIKREVYDSKKDNTRKVVYAYRVRFKALPSLKLNSEILLSEEEYKKITEEKE